MKRLLIVMFWAGCLAFGGLVGQTCGPARCSDTYAPGDTVKKFWSRSDTFFNGTNEVVGEKLKCYRWFGIAPTYVGDFTKVTPDSADSGSVGFYWITEAGDEGDYSASWDGTIQGRTPDGVYNFTVETASTALADSIDAVLADIVTLGTLVEDSTRAALTDSLYRRLGIPRVTIADDIDSVLTVVNAISDTVAYVWGGDRQVQVKATHSSGTLVAGAAVAIRDMGGTTIASGTTDTGGWFTYWRPQVQGTDSLEVFIAHANVTWTMPETMYVSTADVDSIYDGVLYNPSAPPDTGLTHIRGILKAPGSSDGSRTAREDVIVRAELSRGDNAYITAVLMSRHAFADTTDSSGIFDLYVTPNAHISPEGTRYRFWILDSPGEYKEAAVPDTTDGVVVKFENL